MLFWTNNCKNLQSILQSVLTQQLHFSNDTTLSVHRFLSMSNIPVLHQYLRSGMYVGSTFSLTDSCKAIICFFPDKKGGGQLQSVSLVDAISISNQMANH
jgi:hypothetical protein